MKSFTHPGSTARGRWTTSLALMAAFVLFLFVPEAQTQQSSNPSRFDFYNVRLYMRADEVLYHLAQMQKTMGGTINTDEQESVFVLHTHYTRSIVWETDRFTLVADLLQHRRNGKVTEHVVGMSLHPKFSSKLEVENWFQNTAPRYGMATFASKVGPDTENTLYFCQTTDGRNCEGEQPILIMGHNYLLMSDCGYVDRVGEPTAPTVEVARR